MNLLNYKRLVYYKRPSKTSSYEYKRPLTSIRIMIRSIEDQNCVHIPQRLVVPASIFILPNSIDGCYLQPEQITNSINHYIFSPGGTLEKKLQVLFV